MDNQSDSPRIDVEQTIREYIPKVVHMSLGTSRDSKPWVCEVHFAYDDGLNLYFRSLTSRRHSQDIAANPAVAGNIVKQFGAGEPAVGIYFEGIAELISNDADRNVAFTVIRDRLHASDDILEEAKHPDGHQFYKITVQTYYVFGKFGDSGAQKYTLPWNGGQQ